MAVHVLLSRGSHRLSFSLHVCDYGGIHIKVLDVGGLTGDYRWRDMLMVSPPGSNAGSVRLSVDRCYDGFGAAGAAYQFQALLQSSVETQQQCSACSDFLHSIEFLIKTRSAGGRCQGVVLSYGRLRSFTVRLCETLIVAQHSTGLVLANDTWHMITLTYDWGAKRLTVYLVKSETEIQRQSFRLDREYLTGGGQLSLGKWIPASNISGEQPGIGFTGFLDELRVWNKYIDNTEVSQHWNRNFDGTEADLAYLWKFDQQQSDSIITDVVANHSLRLPGVPFRAARLVFSDAPIPFRASSQSPVVLLPQSSSRRRKRQTVGGISASLFQTCEDIFVNSRFGRDCVNASRSVQTQYLFRCYSVLHQTGDLASTQDAIVSYATYCQHVLGLPTWPAQTLCTDQPQVVAVTVIQNLCGTPCYFGTKPASDPDQCLCQRGYWGSVCDQVCPGGASNACSGFGTCNQWSGKCSCPTNRQDASCSSCSPGWLGDRCEVSEMSAPSGNTSSAYTAGLQPLGHVINADGLGFYVSTPGVYSALALSNRVLIQAKLIRCYENFTCTTFLSALIGESGTGYARITIQSPSKADGKPRVYISDTSASVDGETFFHGVTLSRTSLTEILLSVSGGVDVTVSSCGLYLTVRVQVPHSYLNTTSGLLSGSGHETSGQKLQHIHSVHRPPLLNFCRGNLQEQGTLATKSSASVLTGVSPVTLVAQVNTSLDFSTFLVPSCEVFVHFPSDHDRRQMSSGFSLNLGGSAIYSNFSLPADKDNITVELMVRQLVVTDQRQVIFSFTREDMLLLYLWNNTLFAEASTFGNTSTYETGITMNVGQWNKVAFTYNGASGDLTLYHFNSTAWLERWDFLIQPDLFSTPGILAAGSWQPPYDGIPHPRVYPFHGEIENLLVWDSIVEPNLVPDLWLMDPLVARPALHMAWTFDEGQGFTCVDFVGDEFLQLTTPPLTSPNWVASDVEYLLTRSGASTVDLVLALAKSSTDADVCGSLITQLSDTGCQTLGNATRQDLQALCLYAMSGISYTQAGLNTILAFAGLCTDSLTLTPSLLRTVCDAHKEWRDLAVCSPDCVFGTSAATTNTSQCSCGDGYYGSQCEAVCPGGSQFPCSLHGECDAGGVCICQPNWAGSSDCSSCSANYVGVDCSIFAVSPLTTGSKTVAVVTPTSDLITFSGLHFGLSGQRGVYTVFQDSTSSSHTEVQVLLVWCSYGSCTAGAAFTFGDYNVTVLPSPLSSLPAVYINGSQLGLPRNHTFGSSLTLTMTSVDRLTFRLGGDLEIEMGTQGGYLDLRLKTESAVCSGSGGMLDVCKPLAQSSFAPVNTQSLMDLYNKIDMDYKVTGDDQLFQLSEQHGKFSTSAASYCLSFNGTSAWSGPINVNSASGLHDFTISLHVKPLSYGGTILSFGKNVTLSLTNDDPLKIVCGATELNTGVSMTLEQWNQLLLTFVGSEQVIHVFVYSQDTSIQHKVLPNDCHITLVDGAVMSLGEWVPSPHDQAHQLMHTFSGQADELVVWSQVIPVAVVYQVYNMDVDVASFRDVLAAMLKLDEGLGDVAHDNLLSANNLLLPPSPWPSPVWVLSDLQLQSSAGAGSSQSWNLDPAWISVCDSFFSAASVASRCSTQNTVWFRHRCLRLAASTGSTEGALVAMATFIRVCSITSAMDLSTVYRLVCDLTPTPPSWLQQRCADCTFGSPLSMPSTSNLTCSCFPGFWGPGCANSCPGGASNPCHGHGRCSEDGSCWCDRHWTGRECESCADGWTGDDCILSFNLSSATPSSSLHVVGQVSAMARVATFDGVTFDLVKYGFFNLIHKADDSLFLAVQVTQCPAGLFSSHCVASGIVGSQSDSMEINHRSFSQNAVTLFGKQSELVVRGTLTVGSLQFVYASFSMLVISSTDLSMNVSITVINTNLLVTVSARRDVWFTGKSVASGLLTSCSTRLAVQFSACLNQSLQVCTQSQAAALPSTCDKSLSLPALLTFLTVHRYVASSTVSPDGSIITEACLRLSNSGTVVRMVSLPADHFSLEFHVKMFSLTGVLVSYEVDVNNYFILGCSGSQLVVFSPQGRVLTGLDVNINVWTQILISWHAALSSVEIYVTDGNGLVAFKSVRLQGHVFVSGGDLSFGLSPPGLTLPADIGVFQGLLDEVRVWSRPTNPSVVSQTWKMAIQDTTPDLHLHWPLNDGSGMVAKERKQGSSMYAANIQNPPTWEVSDLTLISKESPDVGGFVSDGTGSEDYLFPVEPTTNVTSMAMAKAACASLLGNWTSSVQCSAAFPDTSSLLQQCGAMVYGADSTLSAELFALSLAQLCENNQKLQASPLQSQCGQLTHVGSALPYYGTDCASACFFGWTPAQSSCLCYHGYWGSTCSELCPFTDRGVCNANGVCSHVTGVCSCSPHWLDTDQTTLGYWSRELSSAVSAYACTACTGQWAGEDCSVTLTVVTVRVQWRSALVFSNYLTTWDGASVALITPGTYHLLQVQGVDLVALFLPCPQYRLCRLISAVSLTVDTFHLKVSVSVEHSSNFTATVTVEGQPEDLTFPVSKTWGRVSLLWWRYRYLRVTVDSRLTVVIGASSAGLTVATKLHEDWFAQTTGLLGHPDDSHLNDLLPSSAATDAGLTAAKVSEHQRKKFMLTDKDLPTLLGQDVAGQNLSTCGHMVRLTRHSLTFAALNVAITTRQLTLTFWLRVEALLPTATAVMELTTSAGTVSVSVHQHLILLTWLGGETVVLKPTSISSWTYLAVSWDDGARSLTAFAFQETGFDYRRIGVSRLQDANLVVTDLVLVGPQTTQSAVEIDLLRLWQSAKSLESIAHDLRVYSSDPDLDPTSSLPVLLMSAGFDEGDGDVTLLTVHGQTPQRSVTAAIEANAQAAPAPVWRPSTIPVLDVVLPDDVFHTPDSNKSAQLCLAAMQETSLMTHCGDLHAFFSLYLEACVREHLRTNDVDISRTVADMLAFYCHATRDVGECQLDQYVDFCQPVDDELPVWIIVVICVGVLVIASYCCCFIAFIVVKKKKKRKHERHLGGSVSRLSSGEAETTFIREGSADLVSIQPDVGFVNPAYHHAVTLSSGAGRRPSEEQTPADVEKQGTKKAKRGKGLIHSKKTHSLGPLTGSSAGRPDSSRSSERHHSGFDGRPPLEAWTSRDQERPVSGRRGQGTEDSLTAPQAPGGFSTFQGEAAFFVYSPEQQGAWAGLKGAGAQPPQATTLHSGRRRESVDKPADASQTSAVDPMYRLQSVPDQEKVLLDNLEIEEPTPIVYRRHDDDAFGATSARLPSRPGTTDTMQNINLGFEED